MKIYGGASNIPSTRPPVRRDEHNQWCRRTPGYGRCGLSALKAAQTATIENMARGPSRITSPSSAIDNAIDGVPRGCRRLHLDRRSGLWM
jgi:hypothetical protein